MQTTSQDHTRAAIRRIRLSSKGWQDLDDALTGGLWQTLISGKRVVVSSTSLDARRVFLVRARATHERHAPLGPREHAVAQLVGRGWANKQIAHELSLSMSAVARAAGRVAQRLGLDGRVDLAILVAAIHPNGPSGTGRCAQVIELEARSGAPLVLAVPLDRSRTWARLSAAERSVAELALAGHTGSAIARLRGHRSVRTVANQLACVFRKAAVSGRTELAARLVAG